jgi:curved DNA-binding protein CbpA
VHDYFDILGLPVDAPASEVRRAVRRRASRSHPDFRPAAPSPALSARSLAVRPPLADAAVDFADMGTFVDRIQAAFFGGTY